MCPRAQSNNFASPEANERPLGQVRAPTPVCPCEFLVHAFIVMGVCVYTSVYVLCFFFKKLYFVSKKGYISKCVPEKLFGHSILVFISQSVVGMVSPCHLLLHLIRLCS